MPHASQSPPDPQPPTPDPSSLLRDLLDPDLSPLDLCDIHDLTLTELEAWIESPKVAASLVAFERIERRRQQLIADRAKTLALSTLERLATSAPAEPMTPAQQLRLSETQRKSANKLLCQSRGRKHADPLLCQSRGRKHADPAPCPSSPSKPNQTPPKPHQHPHEQPDPQARLDSLDPPAMRTQPPPPVLRRRLVILLWKPQLPAALTRRMPTPTALARLALHASSLHQSQARWHRPVPLVAWPGATGGLPTSAEPPCTLATGRQAAMGGMPRNQSTPRPRSCTTGRSPSAEDDETPVFPIKANPLTNSLLVPR